MIKEFEYDGKWWLPGQPDNVVSGKLRFSPWDGAVLNLSGSLKPTKDIFESFEPEIVLGLAATGQFVTLHKCLETRVNTSHPGFPTCSLYARTVFVGTHFERSQDIRFKRVSFGLSHLDEWVNIAGFTIQRVQDCDGVRIEYTQPKSITAYVDNRYKLSLDFRATLPTHSRVQKEASIKQKTEVAMESSSEQSLEYYLTVMFRVQNLLSLAFMQPAYVLSIEGITETGKELGKATPRSVPVHVSYMQWHFPRTPKTLHPHDMLFTFKDIAGKLEQLLGDWLGKAEVLGPVCNLYFSTIYQPSMLQEHKFLNLVQGLESLHRRIYAGKLLSDEDYMTTVRDVLVAAIPASVSKDLRRSLETRLRYGNEFFLRKRLEEIYDNHEPPLAKFIHNKMLFIDKVRDTRNYLVHYEQKLKPSAATGEDLYRLNRLLDRVTRICLLRQLGFTLDEIEAFLSRNWRSQQELAWLT